MERQKWEYNVQFVKPRDNDLKLPKQYLNMLGDDGWELVSVDNGIAYFKRPVVEEQPDTAFPSDMDTGFVTTFTPGE